MPVLISVFLSKNLESFLILLALCALDLVLLVHILYCNVDCIMCSVKKDC